jgi:hypothetical protein
MKVKSTNTSGGEVTKEDTRGFLQRNLRWIAPALIIVALAFMGDSCSSQTQATIDAAAKAGAKWGLLPAITNYYEYEQLRQIYEQRDNPHLIMNAYLQSNDGSLRCLGKVEGFGIPYGTQWSQPQTGTGGSVPEPNGLYPSTNTAADWVRLIGPDGKPHVSFVEPNLIITDMVLPCKALNQ